MPVADTVRSGNLPPLDDFDELVAHQVIEGTKTLGRVSKDQISLVASGAVAGDLAEMQGQIDDMQSTVDGVTSLIPSPDSYQAWWGVKDKLARNVSAINIVFLGDSTSNEVGEIAQKMASTMFADYPAWSVDYYLYDFTAGAWGSASRVQTGTDVGVINFRNASVNGGTLDEFTGRNQATIGTGFDVIIVNHGHNYNASQSGVAYGYTGEDCYFRLDESIEDIVRVLPDAPIVVSLQNPSLADLNTAQDQRAHRAWQRIARTRGGISLVDTRRIFLEAGKPGSWYKDDIHPDLPGSAAQATEHLRCFRSSKGRYPDPPMAREVCLKSSYFDAKNLLASGRFGNGFTTGVPDGWTKGGTGTSSQETSDVPAFSANAVKLIDDSRIYQDVSSEVLDLIKGRTVVMAALLKVTGGDEFTESGIMRINGGIGGEAYNGAIATAGVKKAWPRHGYPYANGNYAWKFMQEKIPRSATTVTAMVYGSEASSGGRYALWAAVGLFLIEDFEKLTTWF
ncbi:SGNH/GDSL hydrolase family protein [Nitrobacteraceae bacterium UC4446_H13]